MADIVRIPWKVGGGNIIITAAGGDVRISSGSNAGVERVQTLTFRAGGLSASLKVTQLGNRVILRDSNSLILKDSQGKVLTAKK